MEFNILTLIVTIVALVGGIVAGKVIFAKDTTKKIEEAEQHAQHLLKEAELRAENIRKEKEVSAKERFVQLRADHEKEVLERNRKVVEAEGRIKLKEQGLIQKTEQQEKQLKETDTLKLNLIRQTEIVTVKQAELDKYQEEHARRLEKIAGLTAEEAKAQLIEGLRQEAHSQALGIQQEIIDDAKQKASKEARKLLFKPYNVLLRNRLLKMQ
jgi:ribonuclease Y